MGEDQHPDDGLLSGGELASCDDALGAGESARAGESPKSVARSDARLCARVGCGAVATHTLTADYTDRLMAVGPLSPERTPPALDLCERHSEALTPPEGWRLMRHDPSRE